MKVHSSLQKRPLVLIELLICMGVLSSHTDGVSAVQLDQLASQSLFQQNHLNLNQLMAIRQEEDQNAEVADQQVEAGDQQAVETQDQTEQQQVEQADAQQQTEQAVDGQATEAQAADAQAAEAEAQAQAEAEAQAAVEQPQPVARKAAAKPLPNTPAAQQAAALAAAAEELYPDESKMTAAQKKSYRAKKAREAAEERRKKKEKEARENPTVDENGEHIQTVAEARQQARELQAQLEAGEAAVEEKLAQQAADLAATPPAELAQQEVANDDGHEETVEEVKAKMAALQKGMDDGIKATDQRATQMTEEMGQMPDFGALANLHSSISNMGKRRKQNQMKSLADKLGVDVEAGDSQLGADELTQTLIERAKQAGKSEEEISAALAE